MSEYDPWEDEEICAKDIEVPAWIDRDITPYDLAGIVQGGCDSGAYMPAVTYHTALATMSLFGDEVLQYIEYMGGDLPDVSGKSWSGIACAYLSMAVEIWSCAALEEIREIRG